MNIDLLFVLSALNEVDKTNYFYREWKKAEQEHYTEQAYFDSCIKIVESLENEIQKKYGELCYSTITNANGKRIMLTNLGEDENGNEVSISKITTAYDFSFNFHYTVTEQGRQINCSVSNFSKHKTDELKIAIVKANELAFPKKKKTEPQFTVNQIALIHLYEKKQVTRENGKEIAKQYGHASGNNLFNRFSYYSSRQNRIATESTQKKTKNKIELIESVIPHLSETNKQSATNELNTLKTNSTKED
ncbi:MAG: hypothetical protein KF900_12635 [Bacteroidetes bacterium]|nr:hypothetical protein [Bacteroidota bacterium]